MFSNQIVISIERGIVDVYGSDPYLDVVLVDRGNDISSANFVTSLPVQPLADLAGSEIEQAIDKAIEQGALADCPC